MENRPIMQKPRFFRKILSEKTFFNETKILRVSTKLLFLKKLQFEKNIFISRLYNLRRNFRKVMKTAISLEEAHDSPLNFKFDLSRSLRSLQQVHLMKYDHIYAKALSGSKNLTKIEIPSIVPLKSIKYVPRSREAVITFNESTIKINGGFSISRALLHINKKAHKQNFDLSTLIVSHAQKFLDSLSLCDRRIYRRLNSPMVVTKFVDIYKVSQMDLKNLTIPTRVERLTSLRLETSYEHAEYMIKMQPKLSGLLRLAIHVSHPLISIDIEKFQSLQRIEVIMKVRQMSYLSELRHMLTFLPNLSELSVNVSDFWGYNQLDCLHHLINYILATKNLKLLKIAIDDECDAIDFDGSAHFVELLKSISVHKNLTHLCLDLNIFCEKQDLEELANLLSQNPNLQYFDMTCRGLVGNEALTLPDVLLEDYQLKSFDFRGRKTPMSDELMRFFMKLVEKCPMLASIHLEGEFSLITEETFELLYETLRKIERLDINIEPFHYRRKNIFKVDNLMNDIVKKFPYL